MKDLSIESFDSYYATLEQTAKGLENLLELHAMALESFHDHKTYDTFKFAVESTMDSLYGDENQYTYSAEGLWESIKDGFTRLKNAIIAFFKWIAGFFTSLWEKLTGKAKVVETVAETPPAIVQTTDNKSKEMQDEVDKFMKEAMDLMHSDEFKKMYEDIFNNQGDQPATESLELSFPSLESINIKQAISNAKQNKASPEEVKVLKAVLSAVRVNKLSPVAAAIFAPDNKMPGVGNVAVRYDNVKRFLSKLGESPDMNALGNYLKLTGKAIQWLRSGNDRSAMNNGEKFLAKALMADLVDPPKLIGTEGNAKLYRVSRNGLEYTIRMDVNDETNSFRKLDSLRMIYGSMKVPAKHFYLDIGKSDSFSQCVQFAKLLKASRFHEKMKAKSDQLKAMSRDSENNIKMIEQVINSGKGNEQFNADAQKGIEYLRSNLTVIQSAFKVLQLDMELYNGLVEAVGVHGNIMRTLAKSV